MTVYLVRHTKYSNPDKVFAFKLPLELSKEGISHALKIGGWFKNNSLLGLKVYSSPIKRTLQTAKIIASEIGSKVFIEDRLTEVSCPNLQGKKQPNNGEGDAAWKMEAFDSSREPSAAVQKRIVSFFQEKLDEKKDCIFISHGDPLTALYYYLTKKPLVPCLFDDEHLDIYIKRGEIVKVEINEDKFQIKRVSVE